MGIVTDTAPVGPRLSTRVDIQAGGTAAGARVDVLGEGLAPGSTVTATVSSGPVLLGRTLVNEQGLASLTAQVPDDLGPGQHVVDVRATGADGSPVQSIGAFTIDDSGIVKAVAPMGELLEPVAPDDPILARALQARAAVFDPQRYPAVTASTALLSIAVAGILGVGGVAATMAGTSLPTPGRAADPLAAPLPPVTRRRAKLTGASMQPLRGTAEDEPGPGDRSRSWQWPGTAAVEAALSRAAARLARITDAGPRILADGAWCRAMLGSLALALWLAGAAVGVGAAASVDFALRPPAAPWLVAIVAIGVLDAAAGLVAWLALALGALVTGQVTSWDDVRTAFGIFALYALVPVIANALRPLRRRVDHTAKARFDRLADYVAMPVLVAWAGSAMVLALNGLSGLELVDEPLVGLLRWTIAIALLARLILGDLRLPPAACRGRSAAGPTAVTAGRTDVRGAAGRRVRLRGRALRRPRRRHVRRRRPHRDPDGPVRVSRPAGQRALAAPAAPARHEPSPAAAGHGPVPDRLAARLPCRRAVARDAQLAAGARHRRGEHRGIRPRWRRLAGRLGQALGGNAGVAGAGRPDHRPAGAAAALTAVTGPAGPCEDVPQGLGAGARCPQQRRIAAARTNNITKSRRVD